MYTVYGIYLKGQRKPIYVGRTSAQLMDRFSGHLGEARLMACHSRREFMPQGRKLKTVAMAMHRLGEVELSIRPIEAFASWALASAFEQFVIAELQPACNSRVARPFSRRYSTPAHRQGAKLRRAIEQDAAYGRFVDAVFQST